MKEWKFIRNYRVNKKATHIVRRYCILYNNHPIITTLFKVQHKRELTFQSFAKLELPLFRGLILHYLLHCNARVGGWEPFKTLISSILTQTTWCLFIHNAVFIMLTLQCIVPCKYVCSQNMQQYTQSFCISVKSHTEFTVTHLVSQVSKTKCSRLYHILIDLIILTVWLHPACNFNIHKCGKHTRKYI